MVGNKIVSTLYFRMSVQSTTAISTAIQDSADLTVTLPHPCEEHDIFDTERTSGACAVL